MSAGNSYFTEEVILQIFNSISGKFDRIIVLAPDLPAIHTYKALGYDDARAAKKARLNANRLLNRATRVLEQNKSDFKNIEIMKWAETIETNPQYQKEYSRIIDLFEQNASFKEAALSATKLVLDSKKSFEEYAYLESVQYLLKEMAFVLAANKIFRTDIATYCYHKPWPIFEKLIAGDYDSKKYAENKFLLLHAFVKSSQ